MAQGNGGGGGEEVIRWRWLGFRLRRLEIQRQLIGEDGDGLLEDESGGRSSRSGADDGVGEEEVGAPVVAPCSPTTNSSSSTQKRKRRSRCRAARDRGRQRLVALWLYRAGGDGALHVQMVAAALWLFSAWSLVLG
jgi:hypothetical protein